jgi:hypothetical protein
MTTNHLLNDLSKWSHFGRCVQAIKTEPISDDSQILIQQKGKSIFIK